LDAQRTAVAEYLNGGRWKLAAEFTETESGKDDRNRPALQEALAACRRWRATLVIAKLDRLSRDAHFLTGLHKAGVKFVAVDMPEANEMVVTIMAAVAQAERRMISERTKAALAAAKARGKRLGRPAGSIVPNRDEGSRRGGVAMAAKADGFAADLAPVLDELADLSANAAAAELARRGYPTPRGGRWTAGKVINIRERLGLVDR
jgi:DNA invertase Pin-like site-specific DNA recombinase